MRDALAGDGRADAATPDFARCAALDPGGSLPIALAVPLRGAPTDGLALDQPGVYEVLVNGVPRDGLRARLAATRLLLPVLSLPAGPRPGDVAVVPAAPRDAAGLTVLYPWSTRRTGFRRCPASRLCSSTTSSPGRWRRGSPGWAAHGVRRGGAAGSPVRGRLPRRRSGSRRDGRGDAAGVRGARADRHRAGHRRRGRRHLARHARGGRPRRLRRRAALRRRGPRRARPRTARRPGQHGRRRRGHGGHRGLGTPVLEATTWPNGGVLDEPALDAVAAAAPARWCSTPAVDGGATGETGGAVPSPSARRRCSGCSPTPCWPARRPDRPPAPSPVPSSTVPAARATAGHPGRGGHPRVPFPGCGRAAGRRRSAARVEHGRDRGPRAARRRGPAARLGPDAGPRPRRRRGRRTHDPGGAPPGRPAAGRQPRHPARGAGVRPRDARGRARPALGRRARHRGRRHGRRDVRPAPAGSAAAPPRRPGTAGRTSPVDGVGGGGSGSCATRSACSPRPARTRWGPPTRRCC